MKVNIISLWKSIFKSWEFNEEVSEKSLKGTVTLAEEWVGLAGESLKPPVRGLLKWSQQLKMDMQKEAKPHLPICCVIAEAFQVV